MTILGISMDLDTCIAHIHMCIHTYTYIERVEWKYTQKWRISQKSHSFPCWLHGSTGRSRWRMQNWGHLQEDWEKKFKVVILKSTHKEKCFQRRVKSALLKLEWTLHEKWKLNFQKTVSFLTLHFLLLTSTSAAGRESLGHCLLSYWSEFYAISHVCKATVSLTKILE